MRLQVMVRRAASDVLWPLAGFGLVLLTMIWVSSQGTGSLLAHSPYDSYTLQALAWRDGQIPLPKNYPWLELGVYQGHYWVTFPPVPAVVMWVLTFPFGANTPSGAVTLVYFFAGLVAVYALLRRYQPARPATLWMVFVALGGTILSLADAGGGATGGVWFQAQLLAFFLTAVAFLLVDGDRRLGWAIGLACLALAVGCRPFNLIYAPVLLWMLYRHMGRPSRAWLPLLAAPALILGVYAVYNAYRFGSPLEFGHKYLPELTRSGEGMFLPSKVPGHFEQVFQAPSFKGGKLEFPPAGGFAVYLTNPLLLLGLFAIAARVVRRKADVIDVLLFVTIVVHTLLLLSHRTNGGWQYGTRYFCDLLPVLVFAVARGGVRGLVPAASDVADEDDLLARASSGGATAPGHAPAPPARSAPWTGNGSIVVGGVRISNGVAVGMGLLIAFNVYATIVFQALT
ncbi:MAG: hypothetical protein J7513_16700 [Solirubrobacteraceae bacterium]|nr:hypothetical protein [Solirubrobacteraceae bacterium]